MARLPVFHAFINRRPVMSAWLCVGAVITLITLLLGGYAGILGFVLTVGTLIAGAAIISQYLKQNEARMDKSLKTMRNLQSRMQHTLQAHDKSLRNLARDLSVLKKVPPFHAQDLYAKTRNFQTGFGKASAVREDIKKPPVAKPGFKTRYVDLFNISTLPKAIIPETANTANEERKPLTQGAADTHFSKAVIRELIAQAMARKDIDVFAQPICRLPSRKTAFYELLMRLKVKPGLYVPAGQFIPMTREAGQQAILDKLLLSRCLAMLDGALAKSRPPAFFMNIEPELLRDKIFMASLVEFIASDRSRAGLMIFEMSWPVYKTLPRDTIAIIEALGRAGCRFSLDHIPETLNPDDIDLPALMRRKIRFMKVPASHMLGSRARHMRSVKSKLESNGLGVIINGIEDEAMMRRLNDLPPHYGQGYLLGRPELTGAYLPYPISKPLNRTRKTA